jgi:hypothetical protein
MSLKYSLRLEQGRCVDPNSRVGGATLVAKLSDAVDRAKIPA